MMMVDSVTRREAARFAAGYGDMQSAIRAALAYADPGVDRAVLAAEVARLFHTKVVRVWKTVASLMWVRGGLGFQEWVRAGLRRQVDDRLAAENLGLVTVPRETMYTCGAPPMVDRPVTVDALRGLRVVPAGWRVQPDLWLVVSLEAWARPLEPFPDGAYK
jgi:hypothetical protein